MDADEFMPLFFSMPVTPATPEQLAAAKARSDEYEAWRDRHDRTPEGQAFLIDRAAVGLRRYEESGAATHWEAYTSAVARLDEVTS